MKPKFVGFSGPVVMTLTGFRSGDGRWEATIPDGPTPVVVVAASVRREPDEGLVLWGFHGATLQAYRLVGKAEVVHLGGTDWGLRPAYRAMAEGLERSWAFIAGRMLGRMNA